MVSISSLPQKHCDGNSPIGEGIYPTIKSIDTTPVKATPLKGLGYRGKVTIKMVDFPLDNGTYFGRLIGSNPYYLDRPLKLYDGFWSEGDNFDLAADFQEKLYFIKSIDGPSDKGVVTVEAVDILSKLDSDQAIAPKEYELFLRTEILKENPTDVTTPALDASETGNVVFTNGDKLPKGVIIITVVSELLTVECDGTTTVNILSRGGGGATTHAAGDPVVVSGLIQIDIGSGETIATGTYHIRVDDEIISVVRSAGNTWSIGLRGEFGTEIADHDLDESVTLCHVIENENVVDVLYDLIDQYSGISVTDYITLSDWQQERDDNLQDAYIDLVISESMSLKEIIEELTSQTYTLIWWDDVVQKIKLKSIGPNIGAVKQITHTDHILNAGHRVRTSQAKAINEVWVYYTRRDWSVDREKPSNYKNLYIYIDTEAQANLGVRKVKKIYADSIRTQATASKISKRYVSQNKTGYRTMYFRLDPADAADLSIGDAIDITTDLEQDIDGNPVTRNYLITLKDDESGYVSFQADSTGFLVGESSRYRLVAPNTVPSFTNATTEEIENYVFIAGNDGLMSDGSDGSLILG